MISIYSMKTMNDDIENSLKRTIEKIYELEYDSISENEAGYVNSRSVTFAEKMDMLSSLLAYYVDIDDFERCVVIQRVICGVKSNLNME